MGRWLVAATCSVLASWGCRQESGQSSRPSSSEGAAPSAAASAPPVVALPSAPLPSGYFQEADKVRSGGTWIGCYEGYRPEGSPTRDVMRLALSCGPYHGMRQLRPEVTGRLERGATQTHPYRVESGQCLRVFAVGAPGLQITADIVDAENRVVTAGGPGSWMTVPSNGLWCATHDGEVRVRVQAADGAGEFALQVWLLP